MTDASVEGRLLGFDVREMWFTFEDLWNQQRRQVFLLRDDVTKPLSTDTMVWPSLFDTGGGYVPPEVRQTQPPLPRVPTPSWIGANARLWEDLERMRRHLAEHPAATLQPHAFIAIEWYSLGHFSDAGSFGPYLVTTQPPARDPAWKLLGFDVSDGSLLSGLSNCGYAAEESETLRAQWRGHLNQHHLFDDLPAAFEFCRLTTARVPEHVPFCVYGLFVIREVRGGTWSARA